jgi:hypothetical protein
MKKYLIILAFIALSCFAFSNNAAATSNIEGTSVVSTEQKAEADGYYCEYYYERGIDIYEDEDTGMIVIEVWEYEELWCIFW